MHLTIKVVIIKIDVEGHECKALTKEVVTMTMTMTILYQKSECDSHTFSLLLCHFQVQISTMKM